MKFRWCMRSLFLILLVSPPSFSGEAHKYKVSAFDYLKQYTDKDTLRKDGSELLQKSFHFSYLPCNEKVIYLDVSERKIPQECCYYGIIYVLGMIVRYFPDILGSILTDPQSEYRWLIEQVCMNTRRLYPNYMLNLMTGKSFKFVANL